MGLAVALVTLTTLLVLALPDELKLAFETTYILAVVVATLAGGWPAGILAAVLAAIAIDYFFTLPQYTLWPISSLEIVRIAVYSAIALTISGLVEAKRRVERSLERERVDREVAESATKLRNSIIANFSHEIRTPLTAILGYSEMLTTDQTLSSKATILDSIRRNGATLSRLVDQVLDLAQSQASAAGAEPSSVNLRDFLRTVAADPSEAARKKNLRFDITVDGEVPRVIHADPARLQLVIASLLGNAIRFTEQGFVKMTIRLQGIPEDRQLTVQIEDSGIGISKADTEWLFQPLTQADSSFTRQYGGAGLSLAWSRSLMRRLGGEVRLVRSTVGVGSTFEIRVPIGETKDSEMIRMIGLEPVGAAT